MVDPKFCREPGLVQLSSGEAQDRVEDGYGNSDVEFLVGQDLVAEKRQHVRMDAGFQDRDLVRRVVREGLLDGRGR